MKFSTANIKNGDYNEHHVIFVGTQTGSLKRKFNFANLTFLYQQIKSQFSTFLGIDQFNEDNPYKTTNLQSLSTLTRDSKITALGWADENQNELLVGRADSIIRTFDCGQNKFCETDLEIPEGKVVGVAWNNE